MTSRNIQITGKNVDQADWVELSQMSGDSEDGLVCCSSWWAVDAFTDSKTRLSRQQVIAELLQKLEGNTMVLFGSYLGL